MTRLPPLKAREVIKGLQELGFQKIRQSGSHAIFHHEDGRWTPIPIHEGKTISPYFLSDILKQVKIDDSAFLQAIR